MRNPTGILIGVLIGAAAACGGQSLSAPSSTLPTTTQTPSGQWMVIQRFVDVSGPDNCWVREQRDRLSGAVFSDLPMSVTRANGSITLEGEFFQVNYSGTISGSDFVATGVKPLDGGGRPCKDGTSFSQKPGVSNLTGHFAADDQSMTATELNSYQLTTGEPVTYTWAWTARRN